MSKGYPLFGNLFWDILLYHTGNPCMAVITALMNKFNPVWTERLDGIDFVSSFKGDGFALHFTKGMTP